MQVVILAAGEGKRMRPLTATTPKPLLTIAGRTLLDHIFEALPQEVTEAVIVVKYLGDQIKAYCGESFHGRAIHYADGSDLGTAYSFLAAQPYVTEDRFLFLYGDEFPDLEDIKACLRHPVSILCWEADDPWNHGVATVRPDGTIQKIIEKPKVPASSLIVGGVMVLNKKIFTYKPEKKLNGEFFFTNMLNQFVHETPVVAITSKQKIGGISTPADIERVEELLTHR